jgi:hypothetical protein
MEKVDRCGQECPRSVNALLLAFFFYKRKCIRGSGHVRISWRELNWL